MHSHSVSLRSTQVAGNAQRAVACERVARVLRRALVRSFLKIMVAAVHVKAIIMDNWNCIVICCRRGAGVDECLVQWEASWVDADVAPPGEVVRVLLRRSVDGKEQMLVQWACTWEPIEKVDAAAVEDYVGVVLAVDAGPSKPVKQTVVGRASAKRRKHGW